MNKIIEHLHLLRFEPGVYINQGNYECRRQKLIYAEGNVGIESSHFLSQRWDRAEFTLLTDYINK